MKMTPHYCQLFCKQADKPAVDASLNRDFGRIQEWCNHWCMILNPNKTKALVVRRSRTMSHPHGDLDLSGVSIRTSANLNILGMKFDRKLTFKDLVHGIVSRVSQKIGILRLVKSIFVDTSVLLHCYFAFVIPIIAYCLQCGGQLLNVIFSILSAMCTVFSGQALPRSEFLVVQSLTSCGWAKYVVQG